MGHGSKLDMEISGSAKMGSPAGPTPCGRTQDRPINTKVRNASRYSIANQKQTNEDHVTLRNHSSLFCADSLGHLRDRSFGTEIPGPKASVLG
jgi:hypothetical protein